MKPRPRSFSAIRLMADLGRVLVSAAEHRTRNLGVAVVFGTGILDTGIGKKNEKNGGDEDDEDE